MTSERQTSQSGRQSAGQGGLPSKQGSPKVWAALLGIVLLLALAVTFWAVEQPSTPRLAAVTAVGSAAPVEHPVLEIPLQGPLSKDKAEISGLAWYSDTLILLPQYPNRMSDKLNGALYGLPRSQLEAVIGGQNKGPLEPIEIPLDSGGIENQIPGFEGFEAIGFRGNQVYLTIESHRDLKMMGYVIDGQIQPDLKALRLDPGSLVENPPQLEQPNHTDEALLVVPDGILTFFESNGEWLNPSPHATRFDQQLHRAGEIPIPHLEYRLTDAAGPDSQGRFWVINYFYPGDKELKPTQDPLAAEYGLGPTHSRSQVVERLVELQITPQGIVRTDTPPVQLQLAADGEARNWEGLAILPGKGFLLATDSHPRTILAFVAYP